MKFWYANAVLAPLCLTMAIWASRWPPYYNNRRQVVIWNLAGALVNTAVVLVNGRGK